MSKLSGTEGSRQKREILDALRKLGEALTSEEELYLKQNSDGGNVGFAKMSDSSGMKRFLTTNNLTCAFVDVNVNALSAVAAKQIENARAPR